MNWQQELYNEITAIDDVNANPAVLTYNINDQGGFFGGIDTIIKIKRQLKVSAPKAVSERLVDGTLRRAGDFTCRASYLQIAAAHAPQNGDPAITVNGVAKTLSEVRPFVAQSGNNNAIRWGIDLGDDTLTIGSEEWLIVGIEADKWLGGEPARFTLILRK